MSDSIESLVLDLLEWIGTERRDYHETLDAWRTSCPRLPVWEEASRRGFVMRGREAGRALVWVTPRGSSFLHAHRPSNGRG
jgi:D-3-phosphoglycerate dehydrogenase